MRIFRDGFPFNKARYCNRRKNRHCKEAQKEEKKKVEFG